MIPWHELSFAPMVLVEKIAMGLAEQIDNGNEDARVTLDKVMRVIEKRGNPKPFK